MRCARLRCIAAALLAIPQVFSARVDVVDSRLGLGRVRFFVRFLGLWRLLFALSVVLVSVFGRRGAVRSCCPFDCALLARLTGPFVRFAIVWAGHTCVIRGALHVLVTACCGR